MNELELKIAQLEAENKVLKEELEKVKYPKPILPIDGEENCTVRILSISRKDSDRLNTIKAVADFLDCSVVDSECLLNNGPFETSTSFSRANSFAKKLIEFKAVVEVTGLNDIVTYRGGSMSIEHKDGAF